MSWEELPVNRWAYVLGVIVRGLTLGIALAAAVATLWAWSESARVFRYEAF